MGSDALQTILTSLAAGVLVVALIALFIVYIWWADKRGRG